MAQSKISYVHIYIYIIYYIHKTLTDESFICMPLKSEVINKILLT